MGKRLDPKKARKAFGLKLRQLRNQKKWTLERCEELGYKSWRHLQLVESGKKDISFTTLVNLANLFGITPSELLKDV